MLRYFLSSLICCTCLIVSSIETFAQNASQASLEAVQSLAKNKPLIFPARQFGLNDQTKRELAKQIFSVQIQAINTLKDARQASAIPVLIPFLDYTVDGFPLWMRPTGPAQPSPTYEELKAQCPAFAAIVATPGAENILAEYAKNQTNPFAERLAVIVTLRYLNNKLSLDSLAVLKREIKNSGPDMLQYISAVEAGNQCFVGIYPIDPSE